MCLRCSNRELRDSIMQYDHTLLINLANGVAKQIMIFWQVVLVGSTGSLQVLSGLTHVQHFIPPMKSSKHVQTIN
ncbi:hypothetical protein CVS40_3358 [Lucilia cuprina]|nr:hypothetical protein CVS40_3358 [Lucilia cuprina]